MDQKWKIKQTWFAYAIGESTMATILTLYIKHSFVQLMMKHLVGFHSIAWTI